MEKVHLLKELNAWNDFMIYSQTWTINEILQLKDKINENLPLKDKIIIMILSELINLLDTNELNRMSKSPHQGSQADKNFKETYLVLITNFMKTYCIECLK